MAVSPVMTSTTTSTTASSSTTDSSGSSSTGTGTSAADLMNSFMTLLVAQMQNQDPTNPMDNNQLTSQLAQFNTAAGIETLNSTLNGVGTLVSSMQQMNAAEWVGRTVLVEGKPVVNNSDEDGANKEFALSVDSDADNVAVTLTDSEGNAYTANLQNVKAGVQKYSLDDLSGFQPVDPPEGGVFTVSFSASNDDGSKPNIVALKEAKVDSVSFSQSGSVLQ